MNRAQIHIPDCPYKGLMPYSEEDAPFFFGREAEKEIIIANLNASRLTLLYGPSGVGKSSVLRAGVSHDLREIAQQNLRRHRTPEFAIVVFNSWRDDPITGLVNRVKDSVALALNVKELEPLQSSGSLVEILEAWTRRLGGDLLIVLDQFEEYFLYHPQERGEGTFDFEFPRAVNRRDLRVSFLISIRDDSLAKLDRFKGRIPNLFDNYLRIEHLGLEAGKTAIEKPVERYNNLRVQEEQKISVEPELVEAVLEQVRTGQVSLSDAGKGVVTTDTSLSAHKVQIETPYLQLVLTRLWEEEKQSRSHVLRRTTLRDLGGAESIVRTHVDSVMDALSQMDQEAAARVFYHLVTPGGTKIAHTLTDLADFVGLQENQLKSLLDTLSSTATRILRPVAPPPDKPDTLRYEVFHDVLALAILDWQARYVQARERVEAEERATIEASEQERETSRQRELAHAQALAKEQRLRAEEQAKIARRFRRLTAALAIVFLMTILLAVTALSQRLAAKQQAKVTEQCLEEAEKARAKAEEQEQFALGRKKYIDRIKKTVVTNSIGMKLVYIPPGSFKMGSSRSAVQLAREYDRKERYFTDEFPQHQVHISEGFWMGQTEVSQGQYKSVMNAQPWSGKQYVREFANNPAVYVTWDEAAEFCTKLSQQEGEIYRLPTEAEWEYACRAGTTTRFSFGDSDSSLDDYAWFHDNAYAVDQRYAHPVGQKKPNPWSLYDMHGNVWEWCSDCYEHDYYSKSPSVDPKGPPRGAYRSLRGGSWSYLVVNLRCSVRVGYVPVLRGNAIGFRVVRSQL